MLRNSVDLLGDGRVLPGVANVAGNPPGAQPGRGKTGRRGAGWGVKSLLMKVKVESEKVGLKLNI